MESYCSVTMNSNTATVVKYNFLSSRAILFLLLGTSCALCWPCERYWSDMPLIWINQMSTDAYVTNREWWVYWGCKIVQLNYVFKTISIEHFSYNNNKAHRKYYNEIYSIILYSQSIIQYTGLHLSPWTGDGRLLLSSYSHTDSSDWFFFFYFFTSTR